MAKRRRYRCPVDHQAVVEWLDDEGHVVGATWLRGPFMPKPSITAMRLKVPWPAICETWNEVAKVWKVPKIQPPLSEERRAWIVRALEREESQEVWRTAFTIVASDTWRRERGLATFDYALRLRGLEALLDKARSGWVAPKPVADEGVLDEGYKYEAPRCVEAGCTRAAKVGGVRCEEHDRPVPLWTSASGPPARTA